MPKIVSIHSYRGGTGKSNLVANLVTVLASLGKRVAVIDTDIQSPGIHLLFDLNEEIIDKTLNDYLWSRSTIEEVAYDVSEAAGVKDQGSVFLVPSSVNPDEIARILSEGYNVSLLNEGIRKLIRGLNLDYLFIDTHPGLSKETFLSIAISNILILLLRPDRQDFQGTAVMVDLARQLRVPKLLLVVNKVLKSIDFADLKQQVERTYETPVAGIFPVSEDMIRLGSNGIFCQEHPEHPWTKSLMEVIKQFQKSDEELSEKLEIS
jgi:MinD-like ATPase involved in chromosome partitioning or flagellar assembly